MRERFQSKQTVNVFNKNITVPKAANIYNNDSTFISPIYTFSLAGKIIVYTPIQGTITEKYFIHIICKGKSPTHVENKHLSVLFFFHRPRLFRLSTDKCTGLIRQKWTSKWLIPRQHKT